MKPNLKFVLTAVLIAAAAFVAFYSWQSDPDQTIVLQPANLATVQQGRENYSEHCASCHGVNLEGQPNWRQRDQDGYLPAPPHDASGHTWHHSDGQLFALTKIGLGAMLGNKNFKTRMPAYKDVLTDDQIIAVLSYIKSTWPADIRARHNQINAAQRQ